MSTRFFVSAGGPERVSDVLRELGEPETAVGDGRVFQGRKRVLDAAQPVRPGDEVVVHGKQASTAPDVEILSEWQGLYAVSKPANLSTEPDRQGRVSLLELTSATLGVARTMLHAVTRLDAQVSGIVVVASGPEAKRRAAALKAGANILRRYVGLTAVAPEPAEGAWDTPIGRVRGRPVAGGPEAQRAESRYRVLALASSGVLLGISPVTGRTHQIRIHAGAAGTPLLGDAEHGGSRRVVLSDGRVLAIPRVALHARQIDVTIGGRKEWTVTAEIPEDLVSLWVALGGRSGDVDAPVLDAL